MINFISNETDKSIENASNINKYTDLKTDCMWGNFANITLNNCEGKYSIITSYTTCSEWKENINKTNKDSGYNVILTTGSTEEVKKKNLYDVAGNLWEWTQEVVSASSYYMLRGSSIINNNNDVPVCFRAYFSSNSPEVYQGFRPILYIK